MRINGEDLVELDESFGVPGPAKNRSERRAEIHRKPPFSRSQFFLTVIAKMAKMAIRGGDHAARPRSSGR
jgi:hypothetical protein